MKFGYAKEEIGTYELFFFLANVLTFFWTMGLKNALVSYFPSLNENKQRKLFFNLAVLLLLLSFLAGGVLYLFQDYIAYLINGSDSIDHLLLIILYLILSAPSNFTEYYYLLKEKERSILSYGVVIFSLQVILLTIGILLQFEIKDLLLLMVSWAAIKFLWFLFVLYKNAHFKLDFKMQQAFLFFSFPLILHMLLGNGMEYVDGFLVNYFYDEGTFALFRYGARELPLVTILAGALSTAMIPIAVTSLMKAMDDVKEKVSRLMNFLFPLSIILVLISPIVFPLIYDSEYNVSAQIFNIYLLVISSRILMPQIVLFAKRDNYFLSLSALIELIINVTLSLIFLKYFGLLGIAWATVIAYLFNKIMLIAFTWFKHKVALDSYINLKLYSFWLLLLMISYYISTLYH